SRAQWCHAAPSAAPRSRSRGLTRAPSPDVAGGTVPMAPRRACSGSNGKEPPQRRSERFLEGLRDARSVTFVTHVHPDPDGLGSMMGLAHLVEARLGLPTRLTRDGVISRAENRAMVELLDLDLVPIEKLEWDAGAAVVMVDSQPKTGRHNLA